MTFSVWSLTHVFQRSDTPISSAMILIDLPLVPSFLVNSSCSRRPVTITVSPLAQVAAKFSASEPNAVTLCHVVFFLSSLP